MLVAAALALLLMVLDHRGDHVAGIRSALATSITPVFYVASVPTSLYNWFTQTVASRAEMQRENEQLKQEQFSYRTQLQRLTALEAENARLRGLLSSARKTRGKRMIAEVINVDLEPTEQQVLVNKGSQDGIYEGQAVLDAFGVLGQVIEVAATTSRVLLLTDSRHAIPVRIERTGFNAIAEGTGAMNRLRLNFVPNTTDIREGDLLVSSGLGERFPDGYPVGQIEAIRRDTGEAYAEIDVVTAARMERSGEVMLLWPPQTWQPASSEAGVAPSSASDKPAITPATGPANSPAGNPAINPANTPATPASTAPASAPAKPKPSSPAGSIGEAAR
ncbi:rod shape-determining protein MreC [Permianibacter sp. IMCC34836]|nr:rod shape-determining protein MreC [Permianibacter fluminis]